MKKSIREQFANDAINAPAAVTGGSGCCQPKCGKSKSKKSKKSKCKKTKSKSKSKGSKGGCW